jgi:hypothetical protein
MGYGDELMGSGVARGAHARGKRIAFGNGQRIIWHDNAHQIFRGNPNVAPPGSEGAHDLEWVAHYPSNRLYHRGRESDRWIFSDWRAVPGQVFFTKEEEHIAKTFQVDVVIEPSVKRMAPNKQWPVERYQAVATALTQKGYRVAQFMGGRASGWLEGVMPVPTNSFRAALAKLARVRLYVGPEGGLHHGAAALAVPGVVIFGGFTHPRNTGYDLHRNLFVGDEPCGRQGPCEHCNAAMSAIAVDQVIEPALEMLR